MTLSKLPESSFDEKYPCAYLNFVKDQLKETIFLVESIQEYYMAKFAREEAEKEKEVKQNESLSSDL